MLKHLGHLHGLLAQQFTLFFFYCEVDTDADYSRIKLMSCRDAALYTAQSGS